MHVKKRLKNAAIAERSPSSPKIPKELLNPGCDDRTEEGTDRAGAGRGTELSPGFSPSGEKSSEVSNHRYGSTRKSVLTEDGPLRIARCPETGRAASSRC